MFKIIIRQKHQLNFFYPDIEPITCPNEDHDKQKHPKESMQRAANQSSDVHIIRMVEA